MGMNLKVDPERMFNDSNKDRAKNLMTGIKVRAEGLNGIWGTFDLFELTRTSLIEWLRSEGGFNLIAENFILYMLCHAPIVDAEENPRDTLADAVGYVLKRQQEDYDLNYRIGMGTETFSRLCKAYAKHTGMLEKDVVDKFSEILVPDYNRALFW